MLRLFPALYMCACFSWKKDRQPGNMLRSGPRIVAVFLGGFSKSHTASMRNYLRNILVATALLIGGCDHGLSVEWPSGAPIGVNDLASHHQYTLAPDTLEYRRLRQWV